MLVEMKNNAASTSRNKKQRVSNDFCFIYPPKSYMFLSDLQVLHHVETSAYVNHLLSLKINIPPKMIRNDKEKIIRTLQ